jgi:predicted metal-binding membrane protein
VSSAGVGIAEAGPAGLSVSGLARAERWILVGTALGVSGLAWTVLWRGGAMVSPSLVTAMAIWLLMMVAMMMPATLPWLVVMRTLSKAPSGRGSLPGGSVGLFSAGYFAAWVAFAVVGAALQIGLRGAGLLGSDLALAAPLGGLALAGAGLYQMSAVKAACLRHCRNPMSFFLSRWRNGPVGALGMGVSHGTFCLGCCWALMLLGFVLGLMNLVWMAVLTVVVCIENLAPRGPAVSRALGIGLVLLGVVVVIAG